MVEDCECLLMCRKAFLKPLDGALLCMICSIVHMPTCDRAITLYKTAVIRMLYKNFTINTKNLLKPKL